MPKPQHVYSPRTLSSGTVKRLRVIADVYLFVSSGSLNDSVLDDLENSKFKLIELNELKDVMDISMAGGAVDGFDPDPTKKIPEFTPDLINIMTGELRDDLQEFSLNIKRYVNK